MAPRRFQEDEQPLHVAQAINRIRLDPRPIEKIDIAALQHGCSGDFNCAMAHRGTDRRHGIDIDQEPERTGTYP